MRKKRKLWKVLGIGFVLFALFLFLFVSAFIFNPFEGSLPDMRLVVPRNADFYMRKVDLADDFTQFPEPHFWSDLQDSPSWRLFRGTSGYQRVNGSGQIERSIDDLRTVLAQVSSDSMGFVDVVSDLIGRDLIVAGRFRGAKLDTAAYCAYLRVTWKVRFGWGLIDWIEGTLRQNGVDRQPLADLDEAYVFKTNAGSWYVGRHLDCLMVSNDEQLLRDSIALTTSGGDSFGGSASYNDGVKRRLEKWKNMVAEVSGVDVSGVTPDAVELFLRVSDLFPLTSFDDGWPDHRHPEDMNERVLAQFINLNAWRYVSGATIFEPDSWTTLGRIDMNQNDHTGFQNQFFKAEAQSRDRWLTPFLQLVPENVHGGTDDGACAAAAMRVPAGDFLMAMYEALDSAEKELFNDALRSTGTYDDVPDLINKIRPALLPRIGFVFQQARYLGQGVVIDEPSPAPHVAWVFWIKDGMRAPLQQLYDFATQNRKRLGFDGYNLDVLGEKVLELHNPNIPGTGMIAMLVFDEFFILSNSGPLIRDVIGATVNSRNLLTVEEYRTLEPELERQMNAFVYLNGPRLTEVLEDYRKFLEEATSAPDPGWMANERERPGGVEMQVFNAQFKQYGSRAQLPADKVDEFEDAVYAALVKKWQTERRGFGAEQVDFLNQAQAFTRSFSAGYVQLQLDSQLIEWTSRFLVDYR